jgi:hypothetical protein
MKTKASKKENKPIKKLGVRQLKAKVVAKKMLENAGKKSAGDTLRELGFKEGSANNPQRVTGTKSFREALEELIPQSEIARHHNLLLNGKRLESVRIDDEDYDEVELKEMLNDAGCTFRSIQIGEKGRWMYYFAPDNQAKKSALDMLYKLKGEYEPEKHEHLFPERNLSDAELSNEIKNLTKILTKQD